MEPKISMCGTSANLNTSRPGKWNRPCDCVYSHSSGKVSINHRIKHFIQKNPLTWATDVEGETFTVQLGCDGLVTISERWRHQNVDDDVKLRQMVFLMVLYHAQMMTSSLGKCNQTITTRNVGCSRKWIFLDEMFNSMIYWNRPWLRQVTSSMANNVWVSVGARWEREGIFTAIFSLALYVCPPNTSDMKNLPIPL